MTTETNRRGWPYALLTAALAIAVSAATLTAPALAGGTNVSRGGLSATIRTTEYGIPHVLARDYPSLGFGTGYAAARDNLCTLASSIVVTSAHSSRYFGPDQRPRSLLTRATSNLSSDLYFAGINDSRAVERLLDQPPPHGPRSEVREMVRGFATGFNTYLAEGHQSSCTGAEWLRPMTELDVYRFLYALGLVFGQGGAAEGVVAAQPPTDQPGAAGPEPVDPAHLMEAVATTGRPGPASNGLALGGETTANGRGMVLGNPHFFWQGDLKFWQVQQTIPGKLNVSGAAFLGVPFVALGHTRSLAWSGTATDAATHFTLIELALAPGSPTSYLVDGQREQMTRQEVTVEVRQPDGTITTETRPQWRTRYGPLVGSLGGMALPWNTETAYVLADPNTANLRLGDALFAVNHARRTQDVVDAAAIQGLPWFNLTAADARGRAVFVGPQVVPNVTDEHAARCNTELGRRTFADGLPVLDGSRSDCAPGDSPGAAQPGIFGPDRVPTLHREDYVANANSSHWLTHPGQPMEGFPRVFGAERVEPTPRTRTGHLAVAEQLDQDRFRLGDLQRLMLSNRALAGELARDDTVAMCEGLPGGIAPGTQGPVDVSAACEVLARWDLRMGSDSRGALLFDRFWRRVWPTTQQPDVWRTPFDAADPLHTPRGLNTTNPRIHRALADAVAELAAHEIPLDAPLGDHQYVVRGGERFPISGGTNSLGVYNATEAAWDEQNGGYTDVPFGPTVLQVTWFDGDSCPESRTVLAYSQSSDPTSLHHTDQTELFSREQWITARFCEREILASPDLEILEVSQR